ncbi:MAG: WYL domain-containing protein [Synergistaceae bacterium]|nr:WYL domain-containing protein [Synergistaceae bacterium]
MSKDMSSIRYRRLLKIIALLQSKRKATREELEEAGEYSFTKKGTGYEQNRTLQNDIDFLRDMGAEITYDRSIKKYVLEHEGSFLVNIEASKQEIEALSAGLKMASHFLPHMSEPAVSLWEKITHYIPKNLAEAGDDLASSTIIAVPAAPVKPEIFSLLTEAKYSKRAVNIRYVSPGKEPRRWTLSPYDFYFRGNSWYMVSFNHKHRALSTHRMSRIIEANFASDEDYVMPDVGGFTSDYVSTAWHIAPGNETHSVKIKLSGNLADSMREIKWHPTQKIDELPDGDIILNAEVPYLDEAARWVLAGAPNAKVIEPDELKEIVKDFAMKVID